MDWAVGWRKCHICRQKCRNKAGLKTATPAPLGDFQWAVLNKLQVTCNSESMCWVCDVGSLAGQSGVTLAGWLATIGVLGGMGIREGVAASGSGWGVVGKDE